MVSHRRTRPSIANKQKYESDLKLFSNMKTCRLTFVEHGLKLSGSDVFFRFQKYYKWVQVKCFCSITLKIADRVLHAMHFNRCNASRQDNKQPKKKPNGEWTRGVI